MNPSVITHISARWVHKEVAQINAGSRCHREPTNVGQLSLEMLPRRTAFVLEHFCEGAVQAMKARDKLTLIVLLHAFDKSLYTARDSLTIHLSGDVRIIVNPASFFLEIGRWT